MWSDFNNDHASIAWSNWPAEYAKSPLLEGLVRALTGDLNSIESAMGSVFTLTDLSSATGVQLDRIGEIVGQVRTVADAVYLSFFGFSEQAAGTGFGQARMRKSGEPYASSVVLADAEYRSLLYAKIALNNSHGTAEEIMAAVMAVFSAPQAWVYDQGNAKIGVYIGRFFYRNEAIRVLAQSFIPRAAGVGITFYQYQAGNVFGFREQGLKGFGQAPFARGIDSFVNRDPTLTGTDITVSQFLAMASTFLLIDTLVNVTLPEILS